MSLLSTLPGDIPELLRRGSPVLWNSADLLGRPVCYERGVIDEIDGHRIIYTMPSGGGPWHDSRRVVEGGLDEVALDLTDPTGRVHAAWWVGARIDLIVWPTEPGSDDESVLLAQGGADMTPEQIDTLARLVLRLAGRAP